jgi:hypothetical protein
MNISETTEQCQEALTGYENCDSWLSHVPLMTMSLLTLVHYVKLKLRQRNGRVITENCC